MRSTLASASRGLGELKSKEFEADHWHEHHTMARFRDFSGQPAASLTPDQLNSPTQGDPLSRTGKVGLNQSELLHRGVKHLAGAPRIVGKADRQTSLDRHNEYDAKTTDDCGVV